MNDFICSFFIDPFTFSLYKSFILTMFLIVAGLMTVIAVDFVAMISSTFAADGEMIFLGLIVAPSPTIE
jgi:hypothetical protein